MISKEDTDNYLTRWYGLWKRLGGDDSPPLKLPFEALVWMYIRPDRKYHNFNHVKHCLDNLDSFSMWMTRPDEVEAALWYHDIVYDIDRQDNEIQSAACLTGTLQIQHVCEPEDEAALRMAKLIYLTKHQDTPTTDDEKFMLDIDLSILGEDEEAFDAYDYAIRREYARVPSDTYYPKRAEILRGFLQRPRIYHMDITRDLYESEARNNITRTLQRYIKEGKISESEA